MRPMEFVLWLNGASGIVGDTPPTQEQWNAMREELGKTVGAMMAQRLLERADTIAQEDEDREKRREFEMDMALRKMQMERDMMQQTHGHIAPRLAVGPYVEPTYALSGTAGLGKNFS